MNNYVSTACLIKTAIFYKNTSNLALLMSPLYILTAGEALEEDDFDEEEEEEGSDAEEGKISSLSLTIA